MIMDVAMWKDIYMPLKRYGCECRSAPLTGKQLDKNEVMVPIAKTATQAGTQALPTSAT